MKILLGIDDSERARVVGSLVERLSFDNPKVELVHVLERLGQESLPYLEQTRADLIANYMKMQEDEAKSILVAGQKDLKQIGLESTTKLLTGFSANRIVAHAEQTGADLLAIGSTGKGPVQAALVGSVCRKALVSAPCSILVAKKPVEPGRPLTVVFATDHSAYANRCLEKFVAWRPQGIGRVVVTTVYQEQLVKAMSSVIDHFKADVASWVRGELERSNAQLIQKLSSVIANCKSRVESGAVGDALEKVMKEEAADLLVVGAQGHGFLERVMIGSISLDQAIRRPYSTLVIRA